jgi:hypothetical protein
MLFKVLNSKEKINESLLIKRPFSLNEVLLQTRIMENQKYKLRKMSKLGTAKCASF